MSEPDNLVLEILRDIRQEMGDMRAELTSEVSGVRSLMATKSDLADVRAELKSDIADVKSCLLRTRKELSEQIVGQAAPSLSITPRSSAMVSSSANWTRGCAASITTCICPILNV